MTICGVRESPWPYACSITTQNGLKFDNNTGKLWTDPKPPRSLTYYHQIDSGTIIGQWATYATNLNIFTPPCAMRVIYRLSGNAGYCAMLGGTTINSGTSFDIGMYNNSGVAFNYPNLASATVRYGPLTQGAYTGISNVAVQDVVAGQSIGYILKFFIPANPSYPFTTPDSTPGKNVYIFSTMTVSFEI